MGHEVNTASSFTTTRQSSNSHIQCSLQFPPKTSSMDDLRIEDHPSHWNSTLLGKAFWKDAETFNQPIHADIEAGESKPTTRNLPRRLPVTTCRSEHDQLLYTRFPFNLSPVQGQRICKNSSQNSAVTNEEGTPTRRRPRRFSMNDALGCSPSPGSFRSNRFLNLNLDFGRRRPTREGSRGRGRDRSPSVASETRRSHSLLRFSFNMGRSSNINSKKDDGIESILSTRGPQEPGTPTKPLMFFRGGASWACLPRDMPAIGLDLFWPVRNLGHDHDRTDLEHREVLHIEELAPLCQFRRLRVLKVTGMLQSYQKYIWQAAWLNPELEELELGMAIGPRIRRNFPGDWPCIKGGWTLREDTYGEPVYYGDMGTGTLARTIGIGEYLDKAAIEKAKVRAMATGGRTLHRLSIKTLTLTGFVVDADPFLLWFDPKRLRCVHFLDHCVDAGFYLCLPMRGVMVRFPREVGERVVWGRRVEVRRELKVVELRGGRKVGEVAYRGRESFNCLIPRHNQVHSAQGTGADVEDKNVERSLKKRDIPVIEINHVDGYDDSRDENESDIDSILDTEDSHVYLHEMFVSTSTSLPRAETNQIWCK